MTLLLLLCTLKKILVSKNETCIKILNYERTIKSNCFKNLGTFTVQISSVVHMETIIRRIFSYVTTIELISIPPKYYDDENWKRSRSTWTWIFYTLSLRSNETQLNKLMDCQPNQQNTGAIMMILGDWKRPTNFHSVLFQ